MNNQTSGKFKNKRILLFSLISIILILITGVVGLSLGPNNSFDFLTSIFTDKPNDNDILNAIDNTYSSDSLEYDFYFNGQIKYNVLGDFGPWLSADISGNYKWLSSPINNTQFLVYKETSGALLFDGSEYIYNIGNTVIKEKIDEESELSFKQSETTNSENYTFETEFFNDLLRDLEKDDISSVKNTSTPNRFELNLELDGRINIVENMSVLANTIFIEDSDYDIPDFEITCYITLENDLIKSFEYSISFESFDVELSFDYNQEFLAYSDISIVLPQHPNLISTDDLATELSTLEEIFENTYNQNTLEMEFVLRNQIDEGIYDLSLGTHFRGYHIKSLKNDIIYFNNYFELDSDYKPELEDIEKSRALIDNNDNECWDEIFKLMINDYNLIDDYDSIKEEKFMELNYQEIISNTEFMYKTQYGSNTRYKLGINSDYITYLFSFIDDQIDFNIYGTNSDVVIEELYFVINVNENDLITNIDIHTSGTYIDGNSILQNYDLDLYYSFDYISILEYTIPTNKEEVN